MIFLKDGLYYNVNENDLIDVVLLDNVECEFKNETKHLTNCIMDEFNFVYQLNGNGYYPLGQAIDIFYYDYFGKHKEEPNEYFNFCDSLLALMYLNNTNFQVELFEPEQEVSIEFKKLLEKIPKKNEIIKLYSVEVFDYNEYTFSSTDKFAIVKQDSKPFETFIIVDYLPEYSELAILI